jgi:hypothetical protein
MGAVEVLAIGVNVVMLEMSTFAFATFGLLLLMHEGELDAELEVLCIEYLL